MKHLWVAVLSLFGVASATKADGTEKTESELANEAHALVKTLQGEVATLKASLTQKEGELSNEKAAHQASKEELAKVQGRVVALEKGTELGQRSSARQEQSDKVDDPEQDAEVKAAYDHVNAYFDEYHPIIKKK